MAKKNPGRSTKPASTNGSTSSSVDDLLLAALERGDDTLETGRYLVTFKENAAEEGIQSLGTRGMRVADAREFTDQAVLESSPQSLDSALGLRGACRDQGHPELL